MCNLYRLDKGQDALRRFFKVDRDDSGSQPPLPGIFPDNVAPIIRQEGSERVMQMATGPRRRVRQREKATASMSRASPPMGWSNPQTRGKPWPVNGIICRSSLRPVW